MRCGKRTSRTSRSWGGGWYYLATVLDDYSRSVIAWKLNTTMEAEDVKDMLERAITKARVEHAAVRHRPRLLSDNGSCYLSHKLTEYIDAREMRHSRGKPYHPMTRWKVERYHESLGSVTPTDMYFGHHRRSSRKGSRSKRRTLKQRKIYILRAAQGELDQPTSFKHSFPQARRVSGTL